MPLDNFTKLEGKDAAAALRDVNAVLDGPAFDAKTTTVLAQSLNFLPGCRLLDIADFSLMPAARCHAVQAPGGTAILDGTNAPVYRLAKQVPLQLDTDRAVGYVRFFLQHVMGQNGRFIIAQAMDDIPWLGEPTAPLRKEVGRRLMPLIAERHADGHYDVAATLLVGTCLFAAHITVAPDGLIAVTDQELLIEDLSVRDNILDA